MVCVIWGSGFCAMKAGRDYVPPFYFVALRFIFTALVLGMFMRTKRIPFGLPREHMGAVTVITLLFFTQQGLIFWAADFTRASRTAVILNSQPAMTAVLAHFFIRGDKLSLSRIIALALAIFGVHALFRQQTSVDVSMLKGDAMVLGAALGWAVQTIVMKRVAHALRPVSLVFWQTLIVSGMFFVVGVFAHQGRPVDALNPTFLFCLAYLVLAATAYCFVKWVDLIRDNDPSTVTSFCFVTPVAGVIFGRVLLGEPITGNIIVATLAVGSGIVLANLPGRGKNGSMQVGAGAPLPPE